MDVVEILEGAKRAIQERGWIQGRLSDDNGCVCTYGALNVAVYGKPDSDVDWSSEESVAEFHRQNRSITEAARVLVAAIPSDQAPLWTDEVYDEDQDTYVEKQVPAEDFDIPDWNDDAGRTVEQVLGVLEDAIQKARTTEALA